MAKKRSSFPLRVLLTTLVSISLLTATLSPVVALAKVFYVASFSELAPFIFAYEPWGPICLAAYILPLCFWWWLYTKAMRWVAVQLRLTCASKELGTPFAGEVAFVTGLYARL
jgi:hypothetical protein